MDDKLFDELHPDTQAVLHWIGDCSDSTFRTVLHVERVCDQLGIDRRAPASVHWLYGLYTDSGDAGERMRRVLSSQEVFAVSRLWRDHKDRRNESSGSLQGFADWLTKEFPHIPENRQRDMLLELWQLKIDPAKPGWAELAAEAFGVPFRSPESQASFRAFVHRYAEASLPLESPGRYAMMLTDDGGTYRLDVAQAFAQGLVVENEGHPHPIPATAFQRWRPVLDPRLRVGLGQLQELINSKVTTESDYQRLFEDYPEILFLLGNYNDFRVDIRIQLAHVLCPEAQTQDFVPDFFLHDSVTDLWDVLEIKPPFIKGSMIVGKGTNAHDAFGPGSALRRGLNQLTSYGKALTQGQAIEYLRLKYGIKLLRPRLMLLIGLEKNIPTVSGFSKAQVLRGLTSTEDVYTYDQLMTMSQDKLA